MDIYLAKNSGFCYGVKRAVELALKCENHLGGAVTLGPIIHNPQMVRKLFAKGIGVVNDINAVSQGTVIIRSHGVGPQIYDKAKEQGLHLVDATCPHVKKAQMAAKNLNENDYFVVIVGEHNHPEVKSIAEWAGKNAVIVETIKEAEMLIRHHRIGVVAQTTFSGELFEKIIDILKDKCDAIKIDRTICNATDLRQTETKELAKKVDVMIVVGGKNSANTTRLAEISESMGCKTFHIETAAELKKEWFAGKTSAGITAGASTPDWLIEEVYHTMQEFNQELDTALTNLETGSIVKGKVVGVKKDEVFIDIGYKAEGIIPLAELSYPIPEKASDIVSEGEIIDVYVIEAENAEGSLKLSKIKADKMIAWDKIAAAFKSQQPLEVKITDAIKGGVAVALYGIRGFIPASQLDIRFIADLNEYRGQTVEACVIEFDKEKNKVVLSRRVLLEKERAEREQKVYSSITPGSVVKGKVTRLADFGAFVDIGGAEGLVHISDLSWERVKQPSDVVAIGDEVEVHVLKIDAKAKRISLGLKQRQSDPWFNKADALTEGEIRTGKVTKTSKFGAFVAIAPGVEGLVHLSELADRRVASAEEVVVPGQEVRVKILSVEKANKKISLSIKKAQEEEERAEYQSYLNTQPALSVSLAEKLSHLLKRED